MSDAPLLSVVGGELAVPLVTGSVTRYVNLDYAASTPALVAVAEHVAEVLPHYASVHRGNGYSSQVSTALYEAARTTVARFVGARDDDLVIFTRNSTDALNLLAGVNPGRTLVLDIEHHANFLSWRRSPHGATVLTAAETIEATLDAIERELARRAYSLVAVTGASNVTGETLPLKRLAAIAHAAGARIAVDGAQLVPHRRVHLATVGIDYLVFSGHKTYAPYGAGVLVGRADWLDEGRPHLAGGGAVRRVTTTDETWHTGVARHEAGSPNVIGAAAIAESLRALEALDPRDWLDHEASLRDALESQIASIAEARILRTFSDSTDPVGVVTFELAGTDLTLLAAYLSAEWGIGVRDGRFCAHPLLDRLGVETVAVRASVGVGSRLADVERLGEAVRAYLSDGPQWQYELIDGEWEPVEDPRPRPSWAPRFDRAGLEVGCAV